MGVARTAGLTLAGRSPRPAPRRRNRTAACASCRWVMASAGQKAAARTFNSAIPGIVQSKKNSGKRVHLVDMHAALTTNDLIDGVHPTAGGYDKMAAVWYSVLWSVPAAIGEVTGTPGAGLWSAAPPDAAWTCRAATAPTAPNRSSATATASPP